jgi:hypothetical protein
MTVARVSRPCYDKMHRCPGWAGGGLSYARDKRCDSGRLTIDYASRLWRWRLHRCPTCNVTVLPHAVRWVDPSWLTFWLRARWEEFRLDRVR